METVEISLSTQINWWVERQVQRTYILERLFNHIFSVVLPFICYSIGKIHVDVYVTFRGRVRSKSRAGGYFFEAWNTLIVCKWTRSIPSVYKMI